MFGERGIGTHLPDSDPSYNLQHIRAASDNVSVLIRTSQTRLLLYADVSRMKMIFSSEDEYLFWEVLSRAVTISPFPPLLLGEK